MALIPSAQYPSQVDTGDAGYPQGKARNATTFQDGTGTPLEKSWINDVWGFLQALLASADVTPSGTPDAVGASDYLTALQAVAVTAAKTALDPVLLRLRQIGIADPFTDTGTSMAVRVMTSGPIMVLKSGATDTHYVSENDDKVGVGGAVASITSLVAGLANNGSRIVAVGTGGNRCCFSTDFGATWSAGSDLGATPNMDGIIYNATHTRFMVQFAAGANVAHDVDAASGWTSVATGLSSALGGIAHFANGDTLVAGLDGGSVVAIARSVDGGGSWAAGANVPNPGDYVVGNSGSLAGNGGATIYHAGQVSTTSIRICATDNSMTWALRATITTPAAITFKPRLLLCPVTGVLVVVHSIAAGTVAYVSRDGGFTWSAPAFYRSRFTSSFGIAQGRLFSSLDGLLYATDRLI
jgi:hypothetical protein